MPTAKDALITMRAGFPAINHEHSVHEKLRQGRRQAPVENLPQGATDFCRELKLVDGTYKVVSPMGELVFQIQADARSGSANLRTMDI